QIQMPSVIILKTEERITLVLDILSNITLYNFLLFKREVANLAASFFYGISLPLF
ncbi:MAG: hypothetical protein ACI86C_001124, partial [Candidatus Latescibacterota bacterium]